MMPGRVPQPAGVRPGLRLLIRIVLTLLVLASLVCLGGYWMFRMPGQSYRGPLPPATARQQELARRLRADVEYLTQSIGERSIRVPDRLQAAANFIADRMNQAGLGIYRQEYTVRDVLCQNIQGQIEGRRDPQQIVILGAHYDSLMHTVGADDNASGVAALLAVADALGRSHTHRTLRMVAFVNEEPPFFQTARMGSLVYAQECARRRENILGAVILDGLGYYSDQPRSQSFPLPLLWLFYPDTADFIGFGGNVASASLVRRVISVFRQNVQFPSQGIIAPALFPALDLSDHWSFWQVGYPALLVTDTLPFRYRHYHSSHDTIDKLDFDRMSRVVEGLIAVMSDLAGLETGTSGP